MVLSVLSPTIVFREERMTIYYIFNEYLTEGLGGLGHVWEVVEHLHQCGHTVIVFAPRVGHYRRSTPVRVVYVPTIDIRILRTLVFNFVSFFYIFLFSFKQPPHVLYVREIVLSLTPLILSFILRKPLITEVNGDLIEELRYKGFSPLLIWIVKQLQNINSRYSNDLVCVTEGLKQIFIKRYEIPPHRIHVVPNGTNIHLFRPMDQKICQKELGLDSRRCFVGFIGTFLSHQGLDTLITCAPHVINSVPNVLFLLIGDGRIRPLLEQAIHEMGISTYFLFTGNVPPEKAVLYINSMDICVAPFTKARNDAIGLSPLKLYDYLACGKPLVASDIKGVGDVIAHNNLGIAVPPDNPAELANAIKALLLDDNLRAAYSENGRKLVVEKYNWELTANRILSICTNVIGENKARSR